MIAISRATSSSRSSTSAGIATRPAILAARHRRSPATSWNRFGPRGRTRTGWRTPCSRIDAASSSRADSSKTRRGFSGVASSLSSGTLRTPLVLPPSAERRLTMDGESSRSSERRRAAYARKSGLAKFDDLLRQLSECPGRLGAARICGDRATGERRLAQLHGVPDDRVEDVVLAELAQLVEHLAAEDRSSVVERRQEAQDVEVPVQLGPNGDDDLHQRIQALERVVLRLHRDDHAVRCHEPVDREQAERRWAVDEDEVVVRADAIVEGLAERVLAPDRREQLHLGRCELEGRRSDIDAFRLALEDDASQVRSAVVEDVGDRAFDLAQVDPEADREVRLRIHVDGKNAMAQLGEGTREVDRGGRLADAALLVRDRDDLCHQGITSACRREAS